jgi:hypothetical protein
LNTNPTIFKGLQMALAREAVTKMALATLSRNVSPGAEQMEEAVLLASEFVV